jgi:hypothetical protein
MEKNMEEIERILLEANEAKDRLARIAEKLGNAGCARKARSCMNLVYKIEEWQNRGI